jgi:hypothetical protein
MNLSDAQLEHTTGFPIIPGRLSIGSESDATNLGIPKHDRVLLSFPTWRGIGPPSTGVWPVTDVTRDEHGFCEATLGDFGLAFSALSPWDIGDLSPPGGVRRSLIRGGAHAGSLIKRERIADRIWIEKPFMPIHAYELSALYGSDGLHVAISGRFAVSDDRIAKVGKGLDFSGKEFSAEATIPWETLSLKDFRFAGAYWKFGHGVGSPSKLDSVNRPRDPRKFQDLIIEQGGNSPILNGHISFTPETVWPWSRARSPLRFLKIQFGSSGPDTIHFSDTSDLVMLESGFAANHGSNRWLTLAILGRSGLEKEFRDRESLSMQLAGDALGSVRYTTGYEREAGDPLGWIGQKIRTMSLSARLGNDGLQISAEGEFDDFEPAEIARHRKQRNSQLKPIRNYVLEATMPWALLAARGFSFAYRVRQF